MYVGNGRRWATLGVALTTCLLCACATTQSLDGIPAPILNPPPANLELAEVRLGADGYRGQAVRWGGTIVDLARAGTGGLELEVLELKVDAAGKPDRGSRSDGRFVVVVENAHSLRLGDDITVAGHVAGLSERHLGSETRWLPLIDANTHYRWAPEYARYRHSRYYDQYYFWYPLAFAALALGLHFGLHHHGHGHYGYHRRNFSIQYHR